jgi:hypothetical protein
MSFETAEQQRRLADYARSIVLDEARGAGRWEESNPKASTELVAAVVKARETYARDILDIQRADIRRAQHVIDRWAHNGWGLAPQWARFTAERLKYLEDDDDTESALAALTAAIA